MGRSGEVSTGSPPREAAKAVPARRSNRRLPNTRRARKHNRRIDAARIRHRHPGSPISPGPAAPEAATRDPVFVSVDGKRELRVKRTMRLAVTAVAVLLVLFVVSIVGAASEDTPSPDTRDPGLLLMPAVPTTALAPAAAADRV